MSTDLELLQRAEALIRQRAGGARSGVWFAKGSEILADWQDDPRYIGVCDGSLPEGNLLNAEHIASWDPAVALAVADMVHQAAVDLWAHGPMCACVDGCIECDDNYWMPYARHALALARTYLKEQA